MGAGRFGGDGAFGNKLMMFLIMSVINVMSIKDETMAEDV
jgi:hypothetical protein